MNARDYLDSLAEAQERIKMNQERVRRLHESLTSLTAPMDKEQVSHTKNVGIMADTIARIVDMEQEIDQQTELLYGMQQRARVYFNMLKPINAQLLVLHFIDGKSYEEIGKTMGYAQSTVFLIRKNAIKELQEMFDHLGVDTP